MKTFSSTLLTALGLLLLSVLSGLMTQGVHGKNGNALPWLFTPGVSILQDIEMEGFPVLDTAAARGHLDAGTHLFLDARSLEDYSADHIPGAMPLPIAEFEMYFPDLAPILLPDSPLIVYCASITCDEALRLARRLREAGQQNVSIYLEGFEAWIQEMER